MEGDGSMRLLDAFILEVKRRGIELTAEPISEPVIGGQIPMELGGSASNPPFMIGSPGRTAVLVFGHGQLRVFLNDERRAELMALRGVEDAVTLVHAYLRGEDPDDVPVPRAPVGYP
jgi:hypothetical protein